MATKISNEHIERIIEESRSYNIIDIYIVLAHISQEIKGRYLIQTYSKNKADLINQIRKYIAISYKTIQNNIDKLIELNIIEYEKKNECWSLIEMENMTKKKNKGYTNIREFFLSSEFHQMKAIEKRVLIYLAQLCDSKASKYYNRFEMNLIKPGSVWMKILKTKNIYYARYTIQRMLSKYKNLFRDKSKELRLKDIAPAYISNFKFTFACEVIKKDFNNSRQYKLLEKYNSNDVELVKSKIKFAEIVLDETKVLHIVRAISLIKEWFLKEEIVQSIINKYIAIQIHHSREDIKSLPAYLAEMIKNIIREFKEFREHLTNLKESDIALQYLYN